FTMGHVSPNLMNLSILVAIITIFFSAYSINFSDYLSHKMLKFLDVFDGKVKENSKNKEKDYDLILFGYHRIGYKLFESIKKTNKKFLIVDYNPKVVLALNKAGIDCTYGDAGNKNLLKELEIEKARTVISTIPDYHTNFTILETLKEANSEAIFVATSEDPRDALALYEEGADYVILPHHLGGDYAAHLIMQFGTSKKKYQDFGKKHIQDLRKGKNKSSFIM
ncbi:MAG: NAD-binding protein, partial [archaeon]|nr:NAD-binding protein [archaeon]